MRRTSVYWLECVCGRRIETQSPTVNCAAGGRVLAIEWQAEPDTEVLQTKSQKGESRE